jgi:hypothetical protein
MEIKVQVLMEINAGWYFTERLIFLKAIIITLTTTGR